jgi:hypothetical protein
MKIDAGNENGSTNFDAIFKKGGVDHAVQATGS